MAKPWIHALSSVKKFGGIPEDYIKIHNMMDSSKGAIPDNRHRCLTHNSWFIAADGPLETMFGVVIINSDDREISVRDIAEQHILEDFGGKFIPTAMDYMENVECDQWMTDGTGKPPTSHKALDKKSTLTSITIEDFLNKDLSVRSPHTFD